MTQLSPTALEAAAKAISVSTGDEPDKLTYAREMQCSGADREPQYRWQYWTEHATAAITAYLAQAEKEGWVMVPARTAQSLASFLEWAMQDGPWYGCDLDGFFVQEKAESLSLITATKFDPKKHGDKSWAEPGDEWFVIADDVQGLLAAAQNGGDLPAPPMGRG